MIDILLQEILDYLESNLTNIQQLLDELVEETGGTT